MTTFDKDAVITLTFHQQGYDTVIKRRVYAKYAHAPERVVQEICNALSGACIYFEFISEAGKVTLPVHRWDGARMVGNGTNSGGLEQVALTLLDALNSSVETRVYGQDRNRYVLSIVNEETRECELDTLPDNVEKAYWVGDANEMREEF